MTINRRQLLSTLSLAALSMGVPSLIARAAGAGLAPQVVHDAYAYLIGRALVVRQEQIDVSEPGIGYNIIKYNPLGSPDFANPNLDVAYLEAWIAVDDATPVVLDVPEITGRYYVAQIMDEWGEVITNINERNYPSHRYGKFAFVAPGSTAAIPEDAVRIELTSRKAKMLGRVELMTDRDGAVALQKKFTLTPMGTPAIQPAVPLHTFGNSVPDLIGVEIFDYADALIASAHDICPLAPELQAQVRDVAREAAKPEARAALGELIRKDVIPAFVQYAVTKSGIFKNNWLATIGTGNYGANYRIRSSANLVGIWANTNEEVVYFVGTRDADGQPLNGSNDYVIEFSKAELPDTVVDGYWSVILVDVPDYRVVPNPLNRFNFNNHSPLTYGEDGSLKILLASKPGHGIPESNWLPSPAGKGFSLNLRTYVPKDQIKRGEWFPPAVKKI